MQARALVFFVVSMPSSAENAARRAVNLTGCQDVQERRPCAARRPSAFNRLYIPAYRLSDADPRCIWLPVRIPSSSSALGRGAPCAPVTLKEPTDSRVVEHVHSMHGFFDRTPEGDPHASNSSPTAVLRFCRAPDDGLAAVVVLLSSARPPPLADSRVLPIHRHA